MASISLPPFLSKLLTITQNCHPDVGGWNAEGTEFVVKNDRFEREVLRKYFKGNKSTFIRQLHFYCFKKLDNKGDIWGFTHPKFLRDAPHLIYEIKRKTRTETSGPASKDEVQALRTETVNMRRDMKTMQAQIDALTKQLESVVGFSHRQTEQLASISGAGVIKTDPFAAEPLFHKKPKLSSDRYESDDDAARSNGGSAVSGLLPFEDNSHAAFYREAGLLPPNGAVSSPAYSQDDDFGISKPEGEDLDRNMELGDLTDLFLGSLEQPMDFRSTSEGIHSLSSGSLQSSSSSSSSSASSDHSAPSTAVRSPGPVPAVSAAAPTQENCKVVLSSETGEIPMENQVFAGFLAKFIEHAELLNNRNMLSGDLDPELEIFVHASLPADCPLKDLLTYAPAKVRTVLANVLSDVSASNWQCKNPCQQAAQGSFLTRPLLLFRFPYAIKEVRGECFLHFLAFLLRAAITPRHVASPNVNTDSSPFFAAFSRFFTPNVHRVMCIAHQQIEDAKKRVGMQDSGNACVPSTAA